MKNQIKILSNSVKKVITNKKYLIVFIVVTVLFVILLILLPVLLIPENSISLQLKVLTLKNYFLILVLSSLIGLMVSMQAYNYSIKKSLKHAGSGLIGGLSGFVAGIFGTATCASCVAVLFGFLGIGTLFFLLKYQYYIVGTSIIFILVAIYFTAQNIKKNCCEIKV